MTPKTQENEDKNGKNSESEFSFRRRNIPFGDICLYETPNRFYLIGTGIHHGRKFSVLKIDRTEKRKLIFSDGGHEYEREEIEELLGMIAQESSKQSLNSDNAPVLKARGAGLVGFFRFTEGFSKILTVFPENFNFI